MLIVDGHKSRYDPETLEALRAANIDFIILPAHTSHFLQPLRLNGLIKQFFCDEFKEKVPEILQNTLPAAKKRKVGEEGDHAQSEETEVAKAQYDRLHVLSAIRNAICRALCLRWERLIFVDSSMNLFHTQKKKKRKDFEILFIKPVFSPSVCD